MAGLAAAFALAGRGDVRVTLYEADERFGGKVRSEAFAGVDLDLGPDAFLARRPEAVALCQELGLADALVAPATTAAYLWSRGRLRRLPPGLALGMPTRLAPLARSGVLSPLGLARVALEPLVPGRTLDADEALGALARRRLGDEVHRRLDHASVALVALAYPRGAISRALDGSSFLVARGEGRLMTACSWASSKWAHLAAGDGIMRVGRPRR
jgi:oxygen-dependent protoporphyrinogen oxidase